MKTPPKARIEELPDIANTAVSRQRRSWLKEGRCPECGELGALDAFGGARCSIHGVYPMMVGGIPQGEDPEEFLNDDGEDA
jgi:hypothetical protein